MKQLAISHDLSLPLDAVTQKFAILGRTGSGKSYCATKLCEEMLDAGAQVIALDPVGVWYGLRSGADFNIPIFGGLHGDVPLEAGAGEFIANLIVDRGISAVLDVSQFLSGDQAKFAYDFATRFFFRKKSSPSAVHLFIEECQEFVPQNVSSSSRGGGFEGRMLNAFERLIKLGRNFGIGASLISQRPQEVNKKALNQAECMFAFQMTGPQERKAVASWVADKAGSQDVIDNLPKLPVGECQVWSPQWLRVDKKIKIAKKRTADVSSTPSAGSGKRVEPKPLSDDDLVKLADQMAATIERAKAEDPRELRKEIATLKSELARAQKAQPAAKVEKKVVEKLVLKDAQIARLEAVEKRFSTACEKVHEAATDVEELIGELIIGVRNATATDANRNASLHSRIVTGQLIRPNERSPLLTGTPTISRPQTGQAAKPPVPSSRTQPARSSELSRFVDGEFILSPKQQQILDSLAWYESIGNTNPTTIQLGAVALIDATGGHFSNVVGPLSSHGLIERGNGTIRLTDKGREFARVPENVGSLADYHDVLRERVRKVKSAGGKTVEILNAIIARGGEPLTSEEIGREVGIDHTGGHFSNTIGPLGTLGLIRRNKGIVEPTEVLFPPGLA